MRCTATGWSVASMLYLMLTLLFFRGPLLFVSPEPKHTVPIFFCPSLSQHSAPPLPFFGRPNKRQGASQIYHRLLHPYLDKYEGDIDNGLEEMRAGATRRIQSLGASAASEIAKAVSRQGSSAVRSSGRGLSYTPRRFDERLTTTVLSPTRGAVVDDVMMPRCNLCGAVSKRVPVAAQRRWCSAAKKLRG